MPGLVTLAAHPRGAGMTTTTYPRFFLPLAGLGFAAVMAYAIYLQTLIWR
jgi:hypothetical protein